MIGKQEIALRDKATPTAIAPKDVHHAPQAIEAVRWGIAVLLFLATALSYIDRLTLSVLAPTICRDLSLSNLQYASISVWFLLAYSTGQTILGRLQDKIGTKLGLSIAMALWSVAEMTHALTRGLIGLSTSRLFLGFGEGGHWPASIKAVGEWFPSADRALGMGIVNTGATLGSALAPPLIVWLELNFGWRTTFVATGLLGFAWLAVWMSWYRTPRTFSAELEDLSGAVATNGSQVPPVSTLSWRFLLHDRRVRGIVLARFLGDPVWWVFLVWLPLYLSRARGFSLRAIGSSAWVPFLCADAGALLGGYFSGWLIRRGWLVVKARTAAISIAAVLAPLGVLIAGAKRDWQAIALIGVVLFAFQFWINNVQVLTTDLFPADWVASISGLAGAGAGIGAMIFTFISGWTVDHLGYAPVLLVSGLLIPAATLALFYFVAYTGPGNAEEMKDAHPSLS